MDQPRCRAWLLHLSQVLVSLCSSFWETVLLSSKLISIFILWYWTKGWKYPGLHKNKVNANQTQNIIPSISLLSGALQCTKAVTWMLLSWATLAFCFPHLDLFFVSRSKPWMEDMTPRLCSYLVEHSLQLGRAPFWEERRLHWSWWADPGPESSPVMREESKQECYVP